MLEMPLTWTELMTITLINILVLTGISIGATKTLKALPFLFVPILAEVYLIYRVVEYKMVEYPEAFTPTITAICYILIPLFGLIMFTGSLLFILSPESTKKNAR